MYNFSEFLVYTLFEISVSSGVFKTLSRGNISNDVKAKKKSRKLYIFMRLKCKSKQIKVLKRDLPIIEL